MEEHKILPSNILLVIAHPDDETFLAVGLLRANALAGGVNTVFCATKGEKGSSHLKRKVTESQLKKIRTEELQAVMKHIPRTKLILSNFHDGGLHLHKIKVHTEVQKVVKKIQPDVIVSFGPDGITGHMDHITIGEISALLAKKSKAQFFACTYAEKYHEQLPKWLLGRRVNNHYKNICQYKKVKFEVDVDPKWKLRMLRLHASQVDQKNPYHPIPKTVTQQLLSVECFG